MNRPTNLRIAATANFLTASITGALAYEFLESASNTQQQLEGVGLGAATLSWLGLGAMNLYNSFDAHQSKTNYNPTLNS